MDCEKCKSAETAIDSVKDSHVGLWLFSLSLLYVLVIVFLDSIKHKKFVMSKNGLRQLLDGLTFATGATIAYGIYDASYFKVVATNGVYTTVTALTCIFGPMLNLAERYGRTVD